MYGTQTISDRSDRFTRFENDVKMYGTQTGANAESSNASLRMM